MPAVAACADCVPNRKTKTDRMAGVYMDKQVSGKVKILTGGNGTTGIHNGPIPKPATRESG